MDIVGGQGSRQRDQQVPRLRGERVWLENQQGGQCGEWVSLREKGRRLDGK